jgi:DNA polymerase I-like protein with 3'-5' exonuclease and polymerase domains
VIFKGFKLESPKKTEKGNPSMDKDVMGYWLVTLPRSSPEYHFVKNLAKYRKRQTALGYIDSYEKFVVGDCIHSSLNPTGTSTLRFSSSSPNQQQISRQEEVNTRFCFGPREGMVWYSFDFENLELRIPGYHANEKKMIDLFERPNDAPYFGSYHLLNASIVYPEIFYEEVCPNCAGSKRSLDEDKVPCHCVVNGKYVGQPKKRICDIKGAFKTRYETTWYHRIKALDFAKQYQCGKETADRAAHKEGAFELVTTGLMEVEKLNQRQIWLANHRGYIETIPDKTVDPSRGYPVHFRREHRVVKPTLPMSYFIQSTAMWCTMKAMIRVEAQLQEWGDCYLIFQVHDEIVVEMPAGHKDNKARANRIRQLMEKSGEDIEIPLRVSVKRHDNNWSEGSKD